MLFFFFFQAEDGIRDLYVTGVQTCALPISSMSMIFSSGLLGVSIQTMRVLGLIDFSNLVASVRSTKVKSKLAERRRTFSKSRNVPRSEERRVGKECRSRRSAERCKKKESRE